MFKPQESALIDVRQDGVAGNGRLTAALGALLLVLLAVEGATIPFIGQLREEHILIGMLLLGPVAAKLASTGYRFARYYLGAPTYVQKGPPQIALRLLAPGVVFTTVALFGTGVALLITGPNGELLLPAQGQLHRLVRADDDPRPRPHPRAARSGIRRLAPSWAAPHRGRPAARRHRGGAGDRRRPDAAHLLRRGVVGLMGPLEHEAARRRGQRKLDAMKRRTGLLRRRVIATAIVGFVLLWTVVFVQMATGNDPVLGTSGAARPAAEKKRASELERRKLQAKAPPPSEEEVEESPAIVEPEASEAAGLEAERVEAEQIEIEQREAEVRELEELEAVTTGQS